MNYFYYSLFACLIAFSGCVRELPEAKRATDSLRIFPDYSDTTVPYNIAPLNFKLVETGKALVVVSNGEQQIRVDSEQGSFDIPKKAWKQLLQTSKGKSIRLTLYRYKEGEWYQYSPFTIHIANEAIDPYLVYRRIAPGYRMWNEMGIYQRCLEDFGEDTFLSNQQTDNNCMNCHSFCGQDPDRMLFHQRNIHAGTYLMIDGQIEKLNTKTDQTLSALVYPSWHPSGKYVAFSTNDTKQDFHLSDPNRIEVFDNQSDVVIYDVEKHEIISAPQLHSDTHLETFPTFSPDGKQLYFCTAPAQVMPEGFREMKYSLVRIAFDPTSRTFGQVADTLYQAAREGRSVKFPRISPDGQQLLYTLSNYGNFSIWHKDADLRMVNLGTLAVDSLSSVNSKDVESYHSWSSNSRWFVFSSRRGDGLYTRPYICYIDPSGHTGKPFLLPQKDPDYYALSLFSFNIPELVRGKIKTDTRELIRISKETEGRNISVGLY